MQFMGFLSNVDSSILNLRLDNEYKICNIPKREGLILISAFDRVDLARAYMDNTHYINSTEEKLYYISNSLESDIQINKDEELAGTPDDIGFRVFREHGVKIASLMRLFKEGDVRMAKCYYFFTKYDGSNKLIFSVTILNQSPAINII